MRISDWSSDVCSSDLLVDAVDVEEGFLLAGERGIRQILGSGRRAYGDRDFRAAGLSDQLLVMRANVLIKCLRERRFEHRLADRLAGARQFGDVIDIELERKSTRLHSSN